MIQTCAREGGLTYVKELGLMCHGMGWTVKEGGWTCVKEGGWTCVKEGGWTCVKKEDGHV